LPTVEPTAAVATSTAPLPAAVALPPPTSKASEPPRPHEREAARDTLAPSSFGVLGSNKPPATAPVEPRGPRAAMSTLSEQDGATGTATLRPPGAVPPPPRALPTTPSFDGRVAERAKPLEPPLPSSQPMRPGPKEQPSAARARSVEGSTVVSAGAQAPSSSEPSSSATLDATLDADASASKKANQAALIEQTRSSEGAGPKPASAAPARASAVPPPGLFIADEPMERRPTQQTLVTVKREVLTRMRAVVLVLGGLLLMAAATLLVVLLRRPESDSTELSAPSASAKPAPPACALSAPPSRISEIERTVPISALALPDGNIALAIADSKTSVAGWIYDAASGEPRRKLEAPAGSGDVSFVIASEPLSVDRSSPDFAFARTIAPGLALGVGAAGILRRGSDGATGMIWPLGAGVRVTPPRVATLASGHFVAFRQGGAEGQLMTGWLRPDGSSAGEVTAIEGLPKTLGTPNVAVLGQQAVVLFSARQEKTDPYRVFAATAAPGHVAGNARALDLPSDGGGAIAPAISALPGERYLLQWTDGNVGQYQVHVRIFDAKLQPLSAPLLVSAKGANAGQGTVVSTPQATVSFFIQTTAGHDELWGVALSCH
jgi:hypothetical protein